MDTLEYHDVPNSVEKGYVFGLFPLGNQSAEAVSDELLEKDESITE